MGRLPNAEGSLPNAEGSLPFAFGEGHARFSRLRDASEFHDVNWQAIATDALPHIILNQGPPGW